MFCFGWNTWKRFIFEEKNWEPTAATKHHKCHCQILNTYRERETARTAYQTCVPCFWWMLVERGICWKKLVKCSAICTHAFCQEKWSRVFLHISLLPIALHLRKWSSPQSKLFNPLHDLILSCHAFIPKFQTSSDKNLRRGSRKEKTNLVSRISGVTETSDNSSTSNSLFVADLFQGCTSPSSNLWPQLTTFWP